MRENLTPEEKTMLVFGYAMGYAQCAKDDGLFKDIPTISVAQEMLAGVIQGLQSKL